MQEDFISIKFSAKTMKGKGILDLPIQQFEMFVCQKAFLKMVEGKSLITNIFAVLFSFTYINNIYTQAQIFQISKKN